MNRILCLISSIICFAAGSSGQVRNCHDLQAVSFGPGVNIESAQMKPPRGRLPEHCDVTGRIGSDNKFEVKLPSSWNHRLYMAGNGGTAGAISTNIDTGLRLSFASVSTNTGHDAQEDPGASFGRRTPDNPNRERKVIDFAYRAVHDTAVLAKKIAAAYYAEPPRYSYWVGCSQGGRQGMMEAQRFPDDFNGFVIGAPSLNLTRVNMRVLWNKRAVGIGPGKITLDKMPLLADAVYGKCDKVDGLEDGLIDDPRNCSFDPFRDLPGCEADKDSPDCFTRAQKAGLKKVYEGITTSSGESLFPGQPLGAEVFAPKSAWEGFMVGPQAASMDCAQSYPRHLFFDTPPGPDWTCLDLDFDSDLKKMEKFEAIANATDPNLRPLKQRGGKIIHYQGWADPGVTAFMSTSYYESVLKEMGDRETREFYRLFMMPGVFHCRGGVGCDQVDFVSAIVNWVEKGIAPDTLLASKVENGKTLKTRPLCPYPQAARYKGSGSIDDASNFACADPDSR